MTWGTASARRCRSSPNCYAQMRRGCFCFSSQRYTCIPSAQAALGSLFCSIAGPDRRLVVETHSDYVIDRVRMDVRDNKTDLKPEDVSILYFERGESDVKIHSIRLDERGQRARRA